jgi:hydrogenase maturation protease
VTGALVIGYGDALRSDDGAGPRIADLMTPADGLAVFVRHQLLPELAADLKGRDVVVFVDAGTGLEPGAVFARRLTPSDAAEPSGMTHHCTPEGLLRLAERLYGARPCAFLVTIGAASFELGEELSAPVAAALPEAAAAVRRLIATRD